MENQIGKKKFYKRWWFWSLCIIGLFVIVGSLGESAPKEDVAATPESQAETTSTGSAPAQPLSLEDQITQKINEALGATTNMDKPRVARIEVDKYNASELQAYGYKPTDDVKGVLIVINASENLTTNLQKGTMAGEAAKAFQAIFPLSSQIGDVIVWSQLPIKDQYGNVRDDTAITFAMGRPLYEKINWANLNHRDLPTLLNSEDTKDDRNGSHELIKF